MSNYTENANSYTYTIGDKTYTLDFSSEAQAGAGGYKVDNAFHTGQKKHVAAAVQLAFELGRVPSHDELVKRFENIGWDTGQADSALNNIQDDVRQFFRYNSIDFNDDGKILNPDILAEAQVSDAQRTLEENMDLFQRGEENKLEDRIEALRDDNQNLTDEELLKLAQAQITEEAQEYDAAERDNLTNAYYDEIYDVDDPTTQAFDMYNKILDATKGEYAGQMSLLDAQYQQAGMQQAQVVKQITDQIRAERMAKLRSGMSESQIANQDMQMLMANVDALNQNADMMNQGRLQAGLGYENAENEAYMQYLDQANARGQVGSAMYAADSGNAIWNTDALMTRLYGADKNFWPANYKTRYQNVTNTLPTSDEDE